MKNKKILSLLVIILTGTLALTACDGTLPEGLDIAQFTGGSSIPSQDIDSDLAKDSSRDVNSSRIEHGQGLKIKGEVSELTANTITINGETFTVMSDQDLAALFTLGGVFEIEYYLNADGTITLKEYQLEDDMDDDSSESEHGEEIEFEGIVAAVTANTITMDDVTYTVVTDEDLTTLFIAGEYYEIEYYLNTDNTITLKEYHLEDDMADDDSYHDDDMDDDDMDDDDMDDNSYNNDDDDDNNDNHSDDNNNNDDEDNDDNNDNDDDDNDNND
ncbi:MAG: hypothetical protein JW757_03810 [Anaerolineales bacterium]|nr:hypothetical protein [Anaerolineales bacterium]